MNDITKEELQKQVQCELYRILANPTACLDFLHTAANLYKYDFTNIVAMYMQNHTATAVADFDVWTKALKCTVAKGAEGLRVFSNKTRSGTYARMFDVSQTNGAKILEKAKWEFDERNHQMIFEEAFGFGAEPNISSIANGYMENEYSKKEPLEAQIFASFAIACASIMTAYRLNIDVTADYIAEFNIAYEQITAQNVSALSFACELTKEKLIAIERGIKDEQKRTGEAGQTNLRSDRQHDNNKRSDSTISSIGEQLSLSPSTTPRHDTILRDGRHGGAGGSRSENERGSTAGELQRSDIQISERKSENEIHGAANGRQAIRFEVSNRQGLLGQILQHKATDDKGSTSERNAQFGELDRIRQADVTHRASGRGTDTSTYVGNLRTRNTNSIEPETELPLSGSFVFVGEEIEFNGRAYIIESVNRDYDKIQLLDLTFQNANGYPIFNAEILGVVEDYIGAQIIYEHEYKPLTQSAPAPHTEPTLTDLLQPQEEMTNDTQQNITLADLINMPLQKNIVETPKQIEKSIQPVLQDYRIMNDGEQLGAKTKFKGNIEAIKLLKELTANKRTATLAEQEVLAQFVGWGGLASAFDEKNNSWLNENAELKSLLEEEEYKTARVSTLTSYYTSKIVIDGIYNALEQFGFKGGNVLEPSVSVGKFFGCMPQAMRENSNLYGVEIDATPASIAKQLYPNTKIQNTGFENTSFSNNFFDVSIGNVPFGDFKVFDDDYNKLNFNIHDYFFSKAIDKTRAGGIIAFITSKGTLDKKDSRARQYMFERCDMIGAIRLPNTAFKNAGTEATSDIIFLQKRELLRFYDLPNLDLKDIGNGIEVNEYFAENPNMMLGVMTHESNMYGSESITTLSPIQDGFTLEQQLKKAINNLNATITEAHTAEEAQSNTISAIPSVQNYSLTVMNNIVYYRENALMFAKNYTERETEKIRQYCDIRQTLKELLELQITPTTTDESLSELRSELNNKYDTFVAKYGCISAKSNLDLYKTDSSCNLVVSLEDEKDGKISKAAIFTVRTVSPIITASKVDSAQDALLLSLSNRGFVDFDYMQSLSDIEKSEMLKQLEGQIYLNPQKQNIENAYEGYEPTNEYLAGDIREKISIAKIYAETDSRFNSNIEALTKVIPEPIGAGEISTRLGTTWIDEHYYSDFVFELLHTPFWKRGSKNGGYGKTIAVKYNKFTSSYSITNKQMDNSSNVTAIFGTKRINAYEIIEQSLNLREVVIKDAVPCITRNGTDGVKYVVNATETAIARQKQEQIQEQFKEWIFSDKERRDTLCEKYNRLFNSIRHRKFDGSSLELPGISTNITLMPHQLNAVARIASGNNTLLAHVVGAGKTYTMAAGAAEQLRLSIANKVMFVVPNHIIEQFSKDILMLYPNAKLLASTKADFQKDNRQKFLSRIALGDANMIVIGHSQFEKITMSAEYQERQINAQIEEVSSALEEMRNERGGHFTVKQFEKTKITLELQLKKLNDNSKKDKMITFEQLGINSLFVDEAHNYKNCAIFSKMRNVAGVSNNGAKKSSDLLMKTQFIGEQGGTVTFATGTPISNSICETYIMQRYLENPLLLKRGIKTFDEWASVFGETTTSLELAPEGGGYRLKTRFASFHNLPELMQLFCEVADIQTADMLDLPTPQLENDKATIVPCQPCAELEEFMHDAVIRVKRIRDGEVNPCEDNMLKFISDFRKAGLDMRLINPELDYDPSGKLTACAMNIVKHYTASNDVLGTQLVFCDTSTYNTKKSFDVYREEKRLLIAMGVPEAEIAFIHTAKTDKQKEQMFEQVRAGKIRILLGSTQKCGAGTNIQDRMVALHHLDCPYRPSDIEQREGRILRQGNKNAEVSIYRYVTERSFDAYLWNIVETKQRFISLLMRGETTQRICDDLDEVSIGFAEAQAIASGDPRIKEKIDLDTTVKRLNILKAQYLNEQYTMQDDVAVRLPQTLNALQIKLNSLQQDIVARDSAQSKSPEFEIKFKDTVFSNRQKAGEYLHIIEKLLPIGNEIEIGEYLGFKLNYSIKNIYSTPKITVRNKGAYVLDINAETNIGNIVRIENCIKSFEDRLLNTQHEIEETKQSLESLCKKLGEPFSKATELAGKLARLTELNNELDVGGKSETIIADEDELQNADTSAFNDLETNNAEKIVASMEEDSEEFEF